MTERIAFELNGKTRTVEVAPDAPLLYVLRNELELNNPHFGCGLAQCGACTVHVDGAPTRSCSLPVSAAARTKVTTLAGLGTPEHPHPHPHPRPSPSGRAAHRQGERLQPLTRQTRPNRRAWRETPVPERLADRRASREW